MILLQIRGPFLEKASFSSRQRRDDRLNAFAKARISRLGRTRQKIETRPSRERTVRRTKCFDRSDSVLGAKTFLRKVLERTGTKICDARALKACADFLFSRFLYISDNDIPLREGRGKFRVLPERVHILRHVDRARCSTKH